MIHSVRNFNKLITFDTLNQVNNHFGIKYNISINYILLYHKILLTLFACSLFYLFDELHVYLLHRIMN